MQAIRLLEGIEVGRASTAPVSLLDAARLARIHSTQVMQHTSLLDQVWKESKATAQYFLANPVPPVHHQADKSYVESFMIAVFQRAPAHSSPEDYHAMVTLVEQSQDHVAALYSIFKDSRRSDGLAAASSNLDVWRLRERWSFLLQELVRAKQILQTSRVNVAKLNPPLQHHAYPVLTTSVSSVSQIPWAMDELLRPGHSKQLEMILEDLTRNVERLARYYRAFAEAVTMHPKTDFRMEVFSRVFEGRLRLFCFLERQMVTLMASMIVSTMKDRFNPSTETDTPSFLETLHSGALRDMEACRSTLQEVKALREIWTDISIWLSNFRFGEPGYGHWLWSTDGSPQTNVSKAYKEAQRIVALMDDYEKTLRQLSTFWGNFQTSGEERIFAP
ncbi:hypothetical protein M407DRAFT_219853 [Tulasnella calospora MUT 4182]|uniref:Uncharacterized protein n=1 Tax=Tulasnella calospora MUT 4182 TaxID=1051891 RepID=A0A0C3LC35_9AGAM|nr:hypothetical protein M407DRAFT_219853 [Tulasnella calospora MUT 4182]